MTDKLIERRCSHISCSSTFWCKPTSRKLSCDDCIKKARQEGIKTTHLKLICNIAVRGKHAG